MRLVIWDAIVPIMTSLQCLSLISPLYYDVPVFPGKLPVMYSCGELLIHTDACSHLSPFVMWHSASFEGMKPEQRWPKVAEEIFSWNFFIKTTCILIKVSLMFPHGGSHDYVIKWKHFLRDWPFVRGIHRSQWIPQTKASDVEPWCFLWSASE